LRIPTPLPEAGQAKGLSVNIDIIEDCKVVCKVDVKGRKAPLKLYVKHDLSKFFQTALQPDLKVFISDETKNPGEKNSQQIFINPEGKFLVKKTKVPEELGADGKPKQSKKFVKKSKKIMEDAFECQYIYIAFYSEQGSSIQVACSFPNQEIKAIREDDKL
jgi:hypothetical protein